MELVASDIDNTLEDESELDISYDYDVNDQLSAGKYSVSWNGVNDYGSRVASGIYIYRINTETRGKGSGKILIK